MNPRTGMTYLPGAVNFVAGWRRGQKVGHSKAVAIAVHPDYPATEQADTRQVGLDLAVIRLADPISREKAPFFEIGPAPGPETLLTLISYRQDRPHALTRQKGCEFVTIHDAVMELSCNVTFGASRSPLFTAIGDEMRLVAVLAAMGTDARKPAACAVVVDDALAEVLARLKQPRRINRAGVAPGPLKARLRPPTFVLPGAEQGPET